MLLPMLALPVSAPCKELDSLVSKEEQHAMYIKRVEDSIASIDLMIKRELPINAYTFKEFVTEIIESLKCISIDAGRALATTPNVDTAQIRFKEFRQHTLRWSALTSQWYTDNILSKKAEDATVLWDERSQKIAYSILSALYEAVKSDIEDVRRTLNITSPRPPTK